MLDHLISKYPNEDPKDPKNRYRITHAGIVFKLSYAGKFIIVKGFSISGSLFHIDKTFKYYSPDEKRFEGNLYKHFFDHYAANKGVSRFRIKTLAKVTPKVTLYQVLKREQMELDKYRYDPRCLNNNVEVYIPVYNEVKDAYGWIDKVTVGHFHRWLNSKERKAYIKRYSKPAA